MSAYKDILNQKAVALTYDEAGDAAPVVVASGMGHIAEKIIETAKENGVPVYEDNSLATMLTQLELGSPIPEELYQAIVDIYIFFLEWGKKQPNIIEPEEEENPAETENTEAAEKINTVPVRTTGQPEIQEDSGKK